MSKFSASDTRSLALDHIEAVKAAAAPAYAGADAVEVGLRLAEVYALLAIADALAAGPRTTTGGRLLAGGGVDYSGRPPIHAEAGAEEVPC